jgi:hypothetical protein
MMEGSGSVPLTNDLGGPKTFGPYGFGTLHFTVKVTSRLDPVPGSQKKRQQNKKL